MVLLSSGLTIKSAVHGPEQINADDEGLCHFIRKWMTRGGGDTLFLMMIIICAGVYILRSKSTNLLPISQFYKLPTSTRFCNRLAQFITH